MGMAAAPIAKTGTIATNKRVTSVTIRDYLWLRVNFARSGIVAAS